MVRRLVEHRFDIAMGGLGCFAVAAGLLLLWPGDRLPNAAFREQWQQSLVRDAAGDPVEGFTAAAGGAVVAAKDDALGSVRAARLHPTRLRRLARAMPAIVMPEQDPPPRDTRGALVAAAPPLGTASSDTAGELPPPSEAAPVPGRAEGEPAWLRNAVRSGWRHDRPAVAIVIDDLGLNRTGTAALNTLPGPLTLSFLPYAGRLREQAAAGRVAGHEVLMHMPMEPVGPQSPGPKALLTSIDAAETVARLRANLARLDGIVGINNHMGSRLTADRTRMALVMAELRTRGLLFLDSVTSGASVAATEARRLGVPYAVRDVFIDNEQNVDYTLQQLADVERIAQREGQAIAIGHPHASTIEALRRWLPAAEERGLALVPLSALVAHNACADGLINASEACGVYVMAHNAE